MPITSILVGDYEKFADLLQAYCGPIAEQTSLADYNRGD